MDHRSSPTDALVEAIALRVVELLREAPASTQWISQSSSPLGVRRHCAAVRRLVASGAPGARIIGRRLELSSDALQMELDMVSRRKPTPRVESAAVEDLKAALRVVGGRR